MNGEDTLIGTTLYHQIYHCGGEYKGGIKEIDSVVYFVPKDSTTAFKLYDFSILPGEDLTDIYYEDPGGGAALLTDIPASDFTHDSVKINGEYRKMIQFSGSAWISGIGNTQGLFWEYYVNISGYALDLTCMSHNDTTWFPYASNGNVLSGVCALDLSVEKHFLKCNLSPNPFSEVINITFQTIENRKIEVVDLNGKIVYSIESNAISENLNLKGMENGVYIISVLQNGTIYQEKIIKSN